MKKHRLKIGFVLAIYSFILLVGCSEIIEEMPVATASPSHATASPTKSGLSEREAREIVEMYAETVSRWAVQDDPNHFGYDSVKSFSVGSIKCTKTTETQYYFTVYGSFRGVDKYGSSVGSFTYEYVITIDKDDGDWHGAFSATVRKK